MGFPICRPFVLLRSNLFHRGNPSARRCARSQTRHNYRLANSGTRTGLRAWSSSRSTKTPSSPGIEKAVIGSAPQQEYEQKYPLDQHWSNAYLFKSSAFVNLRLVINGPNEFAKDHQAQTHWLFAVLCG